MSRVKHPQTVFVTRDGQWTTVDEGLLHVLYSFRYLGVETLYSCQGGEGVYDPKAYVLVRGRTVLKLLWCAWRRNKTGKLSESSSRLLRMFRQGYVLLEFTKFGHHGEGHQRLRYIRKTKFERYAFEVLFSRHYGFRICFRWPEERTSRIETLLTELM